LNIQQHCCLNLKSRRLKNDTVFLLSTTRAYSKRQQKFD
jgi:hypothetical protein